MHLWVPGDHGILRTPYPRPEKAQRLRGLSVLGAPGHACCPCFVRGWIYAPPDPSRVLPRAPACLSLLSSGCHVSFLSRPKDPEDAGLWLQLLGCGAPPPHITVVPPAPAPEPSDAQGREGLRLLQQLHQSSQRLWEVTEESLHSLQERLGHQDTVGLESLLLLRDADRVLQVHVE